MKKIVTFVLTCFLTHSAFANKIEAPANLPENLSIHVDFNYSQVDKDKVITQFLIKNNIEIATNNHKWIQITDDPQTNEKKDRYVLLSQVESANSEEVTLHFLILDMQSKEPSVVSKPSLIVRYGQSAQIALENGNEKIKLNILAKV